MTCDPAGEIGLEEDVHRIAQANWPDRKDGVGADGAEGRLLLRSYSGSPLGTYVLRPRGASLFYPRDAWSVPLDTLQTRLSPQSGRGLSVEGGQAARLGLDLTLTPVPISSLYEAGQICDGLIKPLHGFAITTDDSVFTTVELDSCLQKNVVAMIVKQWRRVSPKDK